MPIEPDQRGRGDRWIDPRLTEHVLGLEIAVQDARRVDEGQPAQQLVEEDLVVICGDRSITGGVDQRVVAKNLAESTRLR